MKKPKRGGPPSNIIKRKHANHYCSKLLNRYRCLHCFLFAYEWFIIARLVLISGSTWQSGLFIKMVGLLCAFVVEVVQGAPKFDAFVLLVVMTSVRFSSFPPNTVRPQICISLLTGLSIAYDIWIAIICGYADNASFIRICVAFIVAAKCIALYDFLQNAVGTAKTRKYLARRLRLFGIPLAEPRRILREIRARILAIGWVHFVCFITFLTLFFLSITSFGYSVLFVAPRQGGVSLSTGLFLKTITTALVVAGILLDTDVILCLAHFGCLGFAMKYVKEYTRKKREELGGWPHPFAYNETRFQFLTIVKVIDFGIGLLVWSTISQTFGQGFFTLASDFKAYVSFIIIGLIAADIWSSLLFGGIYWLIGRYNDLTEEDALDDSDDSELDELGVRSTKKTAANSNKSSRAVTKKEKKLRRRDRQQRKAFEKAERMARLAAQNDDDEAEDDEDDDEDLEKGRKKKKKSKLNRFLSGRSRVYRVSDSDSSQSENDSENDDDDEDDNDSQSDSGVHSPLRGSSEQEQIEGDDEDFNPSSEKKKGKGLFDISSSEEENESTTTGNNSSQQFAESTARKPKRPVNLSIQLNKTKSVDNVAHGQNTPLQSRKKTDSDSVTPGNVKLSDNIIQTIKAFSPLNRTYSAKMNNTGRDSTAEVPAYLPETPNTLKPKRSSFGLATGDTVDSDGYQSRDVIIRKVQNRRRVKDMRKRDGSGAGIAELRKKPESGDDVLKGDKKSIPMKSDKLKNIDDDENEDELEDELNDSYSQHGYEEGIYDTYGTAYTEEEWTYINENISTNSPIRNEFDEESEAEKSVLRKKNKLLPLSLDVTVTIDAVVFTYMWESNEIATEFSCTVRPTVIGTKENPLNVPALVSHLQNRGFFVVAAGKHVDGFVKVYIFAAGYPPLDVNLERVSPQRSKAMRKKKKITPIYFLAEIRLIQETFQDSSNNTLMALQFLAKCTEVEYCPAFIAELNLEAVLKVI